MIEATMLELFFWGLLQGVIVAFIVSRMFPWLTVTGPIIMWKSKKGLKYVARLAKHHKDILKDYGDFGIILAFGILGAAYVFRRRKGMKKWAYSVAASLFLLAPSISNLLTSLVSANAALTTNSLFLGGLNSQLFFQLLLVCFGFSFSLLYLIIQSAWGVLYGYLTGAAVQAAVAPALPGIAVKGSPFQIPWYGWLVFPILIFVHELSHGLLVKAQGLKLKASGLVFLGVIPLGAFVEPDDKGLKKAPAQKQMRVYSVGSAANYLTSFFVLGLFVFTVSPFLGGYYAAYSSYYNHPVIGDVLQSSDGYGKLAGGMEIISINGTSIPSIAALHNATASAGPGAVLAIRTNNGTYNVRLNNKSMIGIVGLEDTYKPLPLSLQLVAWAIKFIGLIVFFNFIVGVMNLLPMYPLDGGLMLEALLSTRLRKKKARLIGKAMTALVLLLFLVNMLPLFIS